MKFVHLAPQPDISRIRKHGIRAGGGRRGRGVYAVPLMPIAQVSHLVGDRIVDRQMRSSMQLWKWLSQSPERHRHLAAVVFTPSESSWPAHLYIELSPAIGTDWLRGIDPQLASVPDAHLQAVCNALEQGFLVDLPVVVRNASGVGQILRAVQNEGFTTWNACDDSIEVVFPKLIPPKQIEIIQSQYRTSAEFKRSRRIHRRAE